MHAGFVHKQAATLLTRILALEFNEAIFISQLM